MACTLCELEGVPFRVVQRETLRALLVKPDGRDRQASVTENTPGFVEMFDVDQNGSRSVFSVGVAKQDRFTITPGIESHHAAIIFVFLCHGGFPKAELAIPAAHRRQVSHAKKDLRGK